MNAIDFLLICFQFLSILSVKDVSILKRDKAPIIVCFCLYTLFDYSPSLIFSYSRFLNENTAVGTTKCRDNAFQAAH